MNVTHEELENIEKILMRCMLINDKYPNFIQQILFIRLQMKLKKNQQLKGKHREVKRIIYSA